jgi:hypothetical protein
MAVALMQKLERLGMGKYLPNDPEHARRQALRDLVDWNAYYNSGQYDRDRSARAEAERIGRLPVTQLFAETLRGSTTVDPVEDHSGHIPLNGDGVINKLRSALGGRVTINGS